MLRQITLTTNEWEGPTTTYKWTSWDRVTGWSLRKRPIMLEEPKDHNTKPIGLGNTRILTDFAQKSHGHWYPVFLFFFFFGWFCWSFLSMLRPLLTSQLPCRAQGHEAWMRQPYPEPCSWKSAANNAISYGDISRPLATCSNRAYFYTWGPARASKHLVQ
jgi:hypothetical protein